MRGAAIDRYIVQLGRTRNTSAARVAISTCVEEVHEKQGYAADYNRSDPRFLPD